MDTSSTTKPDKYLKRRGAVWWFQRAIPKELRNHLGQKVIQETLNTSDLRIARKRRDQVNVKWQLQFDKARKQLTPPETPEDHAHKLYRELQETLAHYLEQDTLPNEGEREFGADYFIDKYEALERNHGEALPLSIQRQLLEVTRALSDFLSNPVAFDLAHGRQLAQGEREAAQKPLPELVADFLKVKKEEGLPEKTVKMHRRCLAVLEANDWSPQTVKEALQEQGRSETTIKNYLTNLTTFSRWLKKTAGIDLEVPQIKARQHAKPRDIFTAEEIGKLWSSDMEETMKWVSMVSLYQGFRMGEALQLEYHDIRELQGVWVFDINDRGQKSVKNAATVRVVPVHPWLIENGFLDYWTRNKGWARHWKSYDGTASQGFSKDINPEIRRVLGLASSQTPTGKKVFHSFRHSFRFYGRESGLSEYILNGLGGWSSAGQGEGVKYGDRHSIKTQLELLSKIKVL